MKELNEIQTAFSQTNWWMWFFNLIVLLVAFLFISGVFEKIIQKFGIQTKGMINRKKEHDLLMKTVMDLEDLKYHHEEDARKGIVRDKKMQEKFSDFMDEMRDDMSLIKTSYQSIAMKVDDIVSTSKIHDKVLMEQLGTTIIERSKRYIEEGGVPSSEYESYINSFDIYTNMGGNHSAKQMFEYVTKNLKIIPSNTDV